MEELQASLDEILTHVLAWLGSPAFYRQLGIIVAAVVVGALLAALVKSRVRVFHTAPEEGRMLPVRRFFFRARNVLYPLLIAVLLGVALEVVVALPGKGWLVRVALGIAVICLMYVIISRFVKYAFVQAVLKWVGIPVALLQVLGWLDEVTAYLEGLAVNVGNLELSLLDFLRTALFGIILFWIARVVSVAGKSAIRGQADLTVSTREVLSKLFEIFVFVIIFLVLVRVMGVKLTALAVFGGALALGLGFGLQRIIANYIAGFIILMDGSLSRDDYIQLDDGRAGTLRELNLRSTTLETFDGKDIVVPNELFVTSAFVNWTHDHYKQRYPLRFSVAYDTDLPRMIELVNDVVQSHPQVLSGPDLPEEQVAEAEIESFGASAVNILVEFWMEGIDDGENSVTAELNLMIWTVLTRHNIEMPFPQREVRILGDGGSGGTSAPG